MFEWADISGAIITFCVFSYLWKDNFFFRVVENIFVGASAGWFLTVIAFHQSFKPNVLMKLFPNFFAEVSQTPATPDYYLLIPSFIGILMLCRLSSSLAWLSRLSMAFIVGITSGLAVTLTTHQVLIPQLEKAIIPFFVVGDFFASFSNIVLILGTVSCLFYFFFSVEHKGKFFGVLSKIGLFYLMISFGAVFGSTVMSRISLLIGRFQFLLGDFLGLIK
ncbi:MAG: hypothetical protein HQM08_22435 [Candidatus Riflebacteria bacterium]|nr:hypothetical protein [Candidatus Riflebacteria bacterium]